MAGWREAIGTPDNQEAPASSGGWRDAIGAVNQTQSGGQPQDHQSGWQVASDMITQNTPDALSQAAGQIASQPEFQPFPASQYGVPKPSDVLDTQNPRAVGQVMGTMRKMASLPGRFSQTLGSAVEPVTNAVNEGLAYGSARMGHPLPPELTAAIGMGAGIASDPRTYIPANENVPQKTQLPVMEGSKTGNPTALFDYNDPITGKSSYQIYGDPAQHGYSTTPNVPYETLQQKGIPVVGKTQKAAQLGHEPLDILKQPEGVQSQNFFQKRMGTSLPQSDELPQKIAESREARTGIRARDFQRLYKDPGAIFAGKNVEKAGADIGAAKEAAGINPGVTNDATSLTPENIDRINPTKAVKIEDINTVLGKITGGQTPTPQEAQNALDSVNSILSQPSVQNNRDIFRQWSSIKTHINEALGKAAPDVRAANQIYAREKLGQTFAPMSAVNKSGTPSKLAMLAKQIPAGIGGAIGGALGGTGGAALGYEGGKMLSGAFHAPFIAGLQTAAEGALNPAMSSIQKAITSPAVLAYLQRYLAQKNQGTGR